MIRSSRTGARDDELTVVRTQLHLRNTEAREQSQSIDQGSQSKSRRADNLLGRGICSRRPSILPRRRISHECCLQRGRHCVSKADPFGQPKSNLLPSVVLVFRVEIVKETSSSYGNLSEDHWAGYTPKLKDPRPRWNVIWGLPLDETSWMVLDLKIRSTSDLSYQLQLPGCVYFYYSSYPAEVLL